MTRPQTPEEWEAAVREIHDAYATTPYDRIECRWLTDRLAALLPPAKERVPWWEAKGRTVDGRPVIRVMLDDTYPDGGVVTNSVFDDDPLAAIAADADGMVEVDAR